MAEASSPGVASRAARWEAAAARSSSVEEASDGVAAATAAVATPIPTLAPADRVAVVAAAANAAAADANRSAAEAAEAAEAAADAAAAAAAGAPLTVDSEDEVSDSDDEVSVTDSDEVTDDSADSSVVEVDEVEEEVESEEEEVVVDEESLGRLPPAGTAQGLVREDSDVHEPLPPPVVDEFKFAPAAEPAVVAAAVPAPVLPSSVDDTDMAVPTASRSVAPSDDPATPSEEPTPAEATKSSVMAAPWAAATAAMAASAAAVKSVVAPAKEARSSGSLSDTAPAADTAGATLAESAREAGASASSPSSEESSAPSGASPGRFAAAAAAVASFPAAVKAAVIPAKEQAVPAAGTEPVAAVTGEPVTSAASLSSSDEETAEAAPTQKAALSAPRGRMAAAVAAMAAAPAAIKAAVTPAEKKASVSSSSDEEAPVAGDAASAKDTSTTSPGRLAAAAAAVAAAPAAIKAALTPAAENSPTGADEAARVAEGPRTSAVESTRNAPSQSTSSSAAGALPATSGDTAESAPPPTPGRLGASAYKLFGQQADLEDTTYLPPPPADGEVSPSAYTPSGADARFAALASSTSHASEADRGAPESGRVGSRSLSTSASVPTDMVDSSDETSEEEEVEMKPGQEQTTEEGRAAGASVPVVATPLDRDEFSDANDRMEDEAPTSFRAFAAAPVADTHQEIPTVGSRSLDATEPAAPVPGHDVKPSMDSMAVNESTSDLTPMMERVVSVPIVEMEDEEGEGAVTADAISRDVTADPASAAAPAVVARGNSVDDTEQAPSWTTGAGGLAAGAATVAAMTTATRTEDASEGTSEDDSKDVSEQLASGTAADVVADSARRTGSTATPPTSSQGFANGHGEGRPFGSDRHVAGPDAVSTPRNSRIRESANVQMSPPKPAPLAPSVRTVQVVGASEASQYLAPKVTTHSILIPGTSRASTGRRFAVSATGLSAYVIDSTVRASRKVGSVVQSVNLRGHKAPIVDVEFLPSLATDPLHILGTCDTDSVVFLWFLTLKGLPDGEGAKGPSGAAMPPAGTVRMVRKYSFYTLRRSRAVHYNRIRLAGNTSAATMVLVPNNGSPPRLIKLTAIPIFDEAGERVVAAQVAEADRARDEYLQREDEPPTSMNRGPGMVAQAVPEIPVVGLPVAAAATGAATAGTAMAMTGRSDTGSDSSSQETDEEPADAPKSSGMVAAVPMAAVPVVAGAAMARAPSSQMVETDDASDSPSSASADTQSDSEESVSDEDGEHIDEEEEEIVVEEDVDDEQDVAVPRSSGSVPVASGLTGVSHLTAPMDSLTADDTPMLRAQTFPMENGHSVEVEDDIAAATADALGSTAPGDQYDEADDSAGNMGRQYQDEEPSEGALL
ncbi:hypothetical protein MMPV_000895 [Pyropia vietnamensis]